MPWCWAVQASAPREELQTIPPSHTFIHLRNFQSRKELALYVLGKDHATI